MELKTTQSVADREDEGTTVFLRDAAGEKDYKKDAAGNLILKDGKPQPVTMVVVGTYSSRYRRLADANRDRMIKQRRSTIDGDTLEEQGRELTAGCILSWDGFTSDGQPLPYSKANAMAVLAAAPWIREQVEAAMSDHAAFFKQS